MLIGIFFATSGVAISDPVGTDTQASIGSADLPILLFFEKL
jgi:hypothetical protein